MYLRLLVGLAAVFVLFPAFPEGGTRQDTSQILKKLDEIDRRLKRIEEEIGQLRAGAAGTQVDVRQTPEFRALEKQLRALQEKKQSDALRDAAEVWQALGDPKELSRRLDILLESFASTISTASTREEFKKDVEALKQKIAREVPPEELYERVRRALSERLASVANEREKAWLQRELDALERSEGEEREARVGRFIRFENLGALRNLAEKYSVPREQMAKSGLVFIGHPGPPGKRPLRRDRTGPPGPPPPGAPKPEERIDRR